MSKPPHLFRAATAARAFLEPVWSGWHQATGRRPSLASSGTCGRSSLFLQRVLKDDFDIEGEWKCGAPSEGAGYRSYGVWQGHAWVNVGGWIVDITADQFGADPVVVTPDNNPDYREGWDTALPELRLRRIKTVEAIWPEWLASDVRARELRE